ncbi:MAG: FecR domain-containing protein [Candidatus Omnitrophota bacterium]
MKKTPSFFGIFLMLVFNASVSAQVPLAGSGAVPAQAGLEQVGVVAAAFGKVELKTPGQVGRVAESGKPVFMGDEVKTDAKGRLQILLLDETVFTVGPDSAIVIDDFVYDPATDEGKVRASVTKGVFRYVSGRIAAKKPNNVAIKLPSAMIGIRGTIVVGQVAALTSLAILMGPGENNDARATVGSFVVQGEGAHAGVERTVNRTGFGVQVDQTGTLSATYKVPDADVSRLTSVLAPAQGSTEDSGLGGGDSATNLSGEGGVITEENSNISGGVTEISNSLGDDSTKGAQDTASGATSVADGISKIVDLARITTGIFYYSAYGSYPGVGGYASGQLEINFGTRTIGSGNSNLYVTDGTNWDETSSFSGGAKSFDQAVGGGPNAVYDWSGTPGDNGGTFTTLQVTLSNVGGEVAHHATVDYSYSQGGTGPISGSGSATGDRYAGSAP